MDAIKHHGAKFYQTPFLGIEKFDQEAIPAPQNTADMLYPDFPDNMASIPLGVAALYDAGKAEEIPEDGTQQGQEPAELALPLVVPSDEPQQEIVKQRCAYLPSDGIFIIPEKIAQLQRLFDFLLVFTPVSLMRSSDSTLHFLRTYWRLRGSCCPITS